MSDVLGVLGTSLLFAVPVLISVGAAWHALLFKRDPRAALAWVVVCLSLPVIGVLFYFLFGINRVRARAQRREGEGRRWFVDFERGIRPSSLGDGGASRSPLYDQMSEAGYPVGIVQAAERVTGRALSENNRVTILRNGEQTFPAMLEAIGNADKTIFLTTYIFENNRTGKEFVRALSAAGKRGVEIRVVVDGLGAWYSRGIVRALRKEGIDALRFKPPRLLPPSMGMNLRNHRKILVVDNRIAFAGGMNIGDRHLLEQPQNKNPTADVQFCFEGPVAAQLTDIFLDTWGICRGDQQSLAPAHFDSAVQNNNGDMDRDEEGKVGASMCRAIADGPDDNLDKLELVFVAAMDSAQRSIRIMTPYFLPDQGMIAILQSAALRGLDVSIVLPEKNNLFYIHWATRNMLWELLSCNVKVYYQPGTFVHTKLLLIDESYALVGSANLDPRSLRLNYELGVEVYDRAVATELIADFDAVVARSASITQQSLDNRSLLARTRDALCWLGSPYL